MDIESTKQVLNADSVFRQRLQYTAQRLGDLVGSYIVIIAVPTDDENGDFVGYACGDGDVPDALLENFHLKR